MDTSDFISVLAANKQLVWPAVQDYITQIKSLPSYCQIPKKYQDILDFHYKLVSDYPERKGKYLRPSLVMVTGQAMGADPKNLLTAAAAMQISEEWILVHDDIEDNSEERRGLPSLHRLYGPQLAINAGDALHVLMWKAIFDTLKQLPQVSDRLFEEYFQLLNRTTLGQTIDIEWTRDNILDLSQDDIFLILESKTCYYTISGPMRLGAIIAGATEDQLNHLYQFGIYLGRAFQVVDDLLDLTSDFSGLKKQQYNDLYEGKRTVLLSHLWHQATEVEKQTIHAIMSKTRSQKTTTDVGTIVELMNKYNTFDYTRSLAQNLGSQARDYFHAHLDFIAADPFRSQIESGIDFIVKRDH